MGAGTVINSLLGLVFYILLARFLGVNFFGEFSFYLSLGVMAAEIGDLGFSSSLVKFGGDKFRENFSLVFFQRVAAVLIIIFIFLAGSLLFKKPLLIYSAATGASLLFLSLITQSFLTRQFYPGFVFSNIFGNTFRLIITYFLATTNLLTVVSSLVVFTLANFFATIFGYVFITFREKDLMLGFDKLFENFRRVWQYTKYVAMSFTVTSISAKMDIPIIYLLAGPGGAGLYSSASKLLSVFPQVSVAFEGVFSPKISQNENKAFKDYLTLSGLACLGLLMVLPIANIVIPVLFGSEYILAIPIFDILILGLIPFFLSGPFAATILYRFGKSSYHFLISMVTWGVSLFLYFVLVPNFGAVGAALTAGITNIVTFALYVFIYKKFKNAKN